MADVLDDLVTVTTVTTAATPLAAVGIGLALAFVLAPKIAARAIRFIKSIA